MRTLSRTALTVVVLAGALCATDRKLLSLVMPDVKVLAGVNVRGAAGTPLGRDTLTRIMAGSKQLQQVSSSFGVNPKSVREFLVASSGPPKFESNIVLARGSFHSGSIISNAVRNGSVTETYRKVTILQDAGRTIGLAFLRSNRLVTGDVASVKAVIDREETRSEMSSELSAQVTRLSAVDDAWAISAGPVAGLLPGTVSTGRTGLAAMLSPAMVLQGITNATAGVKFGKTAALTVQAQAGTPEAAKMLGDTLKLMVNMLLLAPKQDAGLTAAIQSLAVASQGSTLNVSAQFTGPEFQKMMELIPGAVKK